MVTPQLGGGPIRLLKLLLIGRLPRWAQTGAHSSSPFNHTCFEVKSLGKKNWPISFIHSYCWYINNLKVDQMNRFVLPLSAAIHTHRDDCGAFWAVSSQGWLNIRRQSENTSPWRQGQLSCISGRRLRGSFLHTSRWVCSENVSILDRSFLLICKERTAHKPRDKTVSPWFERN